MCNQISFLISQQTYLFIAGGDLHFIYLYLSMGFSFCGRLAQRDYLFICSSSVCLAGRGGAAILILCVYFQSPWMWDTRHCWYGYPYQVQCSYISRLANIPVHVAPALRHLHDGFVHVFVSLREQSSLSPSSWLNKQQSNGRRVVTSRLLCCLFLLIRKGAGVMQTSPQATEGFFHIELS